MNTVFLNLPMQSPFLIKSDNVDLIERLHLKYGCYCTTQAIPGARQILVAQVGDHYTIRVDHHSVATSAPLAEIDHYIFTHPNYDERILALHGGAVEWKGEAYLFLAATTSGKTTLTSYLTSRGFGYLTDDCILVERSNFLVHPYTTPIQLRAGGLEVLKSYQAVPAEIQLLEEGAAFRRFVYTPENCVSAAIPLKHIFFLERTERENALLTMNSTERITSLMKSPITNYKIDGDYLRFLAKLARVDCDILRYRDMDFVKELIQHG